MLCYDGVEMKGSVCVWNRSYHIFYVSLFIYLNDWFNLICLLLLFLTLYWKPFHTYLVQILLIYSASKVTFDSVHFCFFSTAFIVVSIRVFVHVMFCSYALWSVCYCGITEVNIVLFTLHRSSLRLMGVLCLSSSTVKLVR